VILVGVLRLNRIMSLLKRKMERLLLELGKEVEEEELELEEVVVIEVEEVAGEAEAAEEVEVVDLVEEEAA